MKQTVVVNNISKSFALSKKQKKLEKTENNIKKAVEDVSFVTYEGEVYGLLGPNGAGKTTTLRMLATLIKPNHGQISILGYDIKDEEVKKHISFLTNELKLESNFTPEYLFNYFAKLRGMNDEEIATRKEYLFNKFGINKFKEVKIADLSTGMKQKTSIALSIIHDPDVIIFDEPTLGLDVLTSKVVKEFLFELKEKGKTVIISSHIMSFVEQVCDRIGIIIDGKLVMCDTVENIKSQSETQSLEDVFFKLYDEVHEGGIE